MNLNDISNFIFSCSIYGHNTILYLNQLNYLEQSLHPLRIYSFSLEFFLLLKDFKSFTNLFFNFALLSIVFINFLYY
jgi:hypothetical protein